MNSFSRKAISVGLVLATALWFAGSSFAPLASAAGLSTQQVDSILSLLQSFGADQATINNVQAALTGQPTTTGGSSTPSTSSYTFTKVLTLGSKGADVTALQNFLNAKGYLTVSATGYFGSLTKAALAKFQAAQSISPASGYFGPITMKAVNAMMGTVTTTGGSGTTVVPSAPGLTVSLASDNPAAGTIVAGQAVADLAHFTFTNGDSNAVNVTQVVLKRIGVSADTTLNNVYLYNGTTRITDAATVSNGVITFSAPNGIFSVPAKSSVTIAVKADILSGTSGQTVGVQVSSITSNATAFSGAPLSGNTMTVASASLATVAVGTVTPATTGVNAGTSNYAIWSSQLSIGTRSVNLMHVSYKVIGSIPSNAFANIGLYLNGTKIASASGIDSNNLINFDIPSGQVIQTGSATLEVRADIVNGSSRTFSLSLQNAADLIVVDSNYNVNVSATGIPATTGTVTINQGSVAVSVDPNFDVSTVPGGASGVILGQFAMKAYGEDMKISYLTVTPSINVDNVTLYVNGAQVGSTYNYTGTALQFSLGSSLVIPGGATDILVVKADTKSNGTNIATGTVSIALSGPANNAQGMSSLQLTTVPSGTVAGPTLTITSGALTVAPNAQFQNQSIVANTSKQEIGSYVLQAGSGEPLNVTNFTVALAGSFPVTSLSNLYVAAGSWQSTPINPQTSNGIPVTLTLATSSSQTVNVYADVGSLGTVANTNSPSASVATTTSPTASVAATGTVTVGGTIVNSTTTAITINGYPSNYTTAASGDTTSSVATALASAINANTNVNGTVSASASGGVVTITAKVAGSAGNNVTLTATTVGTMTLTASGSTLAGGSNGATQVNTVTIGSDVVTGNTFTVTISGTAYTHTTSSGSPSSSTVATALATAMSGSSVVTASATNGVLTLTAKTAGTAGAFTVAASAAQGSHGLNNSTIQTTLAVTANGQISNTSASVAAVTGQTLTLGTGSLGTPTFVQSVSPATQYQTGGLTGASVATYNFVSSIGTSNIQEMRFTVAASTSTPVTSITVGGVTAPVVSGAADVSGLNIAVPMSYAGQNVSVTANYAPVGLGGIPSGATSTVSLTYVKYQNGNTTATLSPSVSANSMMLVAGYPTVAVVQPTAVFSNANQNELVDVTFGASGNTIAVGTTTFVVASNNIGNVSLSGANLYQGNTVLSGSSCSLTNNTTTAVTVTCTLPSGYNITPGTTQTLALKATVSGASVPSSGTYGVVTSLGAPSTFSWSDVNGNGGPYASTNTTYLQNYPTNGMSVHN